MKKITSGLLAGAIVGGITGLFTAKRSGRQTQQLVKDYLDGISEDVLELNDSLARLRKAAAILTKESSQNTSQTMQELQQLFSDFNFQTEPRIKKVKDASEKIQRDLNSDGSFNSATTDDADDM
ncbi:hypothetical protein AYR54_02890 [Loigolactobacillus backii]|uniref:YtxH domain-containing protein n=1 Tax=Loigolactobacillus backii TaxID=375175 RepID=UPI0007F169E7|nr:YtxH domain-containing protein [Loigolactobacillus backii]ANK59285.1 hypothetical protein AYR52_02890 [Loigolactobacillus backii]ANK64277.1 hypothetical protein AYR54_02890 [Loigolactobacillus backii]ANK67329.1 hypothetical protein AYR55_06155 [Loigolactobacillus backii]OLF70325.1 hypothetical protein ACX53_03145 [Loigolactobacillus backii]PIO88056.1 hypothetical protein B8A32_02900 [Loigolactobacillus backii]